MSDWEDFCDFMGVANDEDAFDKILDSIERSNAKSDRDDYISKKMVFDSFQQAIEWAKENPGKKITRSPDGQGFVEK